MSVVYPGSDLYHYTHHVSSLFPEDTDETVTLTAGGTDNTFGAWAEITDGVNTLSSKFATKPGHVCAIIVEDVNQVDERYVLEISYGAAYVMIGRTRFMKSGVLVNVEHSRRIRSIHVPPGETVYYRLKCETLGKTAIVQFRYYNF
ncbi:hypothetical protein ES703_43619 [subsurface metagenome]